VSAHALDAAGVLAAVVLVTGVFLLIWGAVALVRVIPGWWRLLAIPAALVLSWFVLYGVGVRRRCRDQIRRIRGAVPLAAI